MAKAKQKELPGIEGVGRIPQLHAAALEYAGVRDERMQLTEQEAELKEKLLGLMKEYKKEIYICEGLEIKIVHEVETIKVKVIKEKQDKEAA